MTLLWGAVWTMTLSAGSHYASGTNEAGMKCGNLDSPRFAHSGCATIIGMEGVIGRKPLSDLARPAGIEPATPAFGGQYSIH